MQTEAPTSTQYPRVRAARWAVGIAFGLGLAFELLLDGHMPGVSVPLWIGLCVVGLLLVARLERADISLQGAIWPVIVLSLAMVFPFRLEPLTIGLTVVLGLLALTIWVDTLLPGDLFRFGWLDLLRSTLLTPLLMLVRPWAVLGDAWHRSVREEGWRRPTFSILRGVLLALPILAVFTALLASADVVFAGYVEDVLLWLDLERLLDLLSRAVVILFTAIISLGALAVGLQTRRDRRRSGEDGPLVSPFLGYTETMVVLVLMDLLFAAFVAIQFAYLFGGEANISLRGYTYAEYARRGFGELVFTAALSLGLIYLLAQITRRQSARQVRGFNLLSALQVVLLGVVLVSAFRRLVLYEDAYGFTRLRTYTHVAIGWIGLALVVFVFLLLSDRLRRVAPAAFLGAAGFALTLAVVNIDAFIVECRIQRRHHRARGQGEAGNRDGRDTHHHPGPQGAPGDHQQQQRQGHRDDRHHPGQLPALEQQEQVAHGQNVVRHDGSAQHRDLARIAQVQRGQQQADRRQIPAQAATHCIQYRPQPQVNGQIERHGIEVWRHGQRQVGHALQHGIPGDDKTKRGKPPAGAAVDEAGNSHPGLRKTIAKTTCRARIKRSGGGRRYKKATEILRRCDCLYSE